MKMRLQPIRVYCLHHVCATFDADSMNACDFTQIDEFKSKVLAMQQNGVEFIRITEAYRHICEDYIRCKKYAVLTFDDGYTSLNEILPWLKEQQIPCTLFINGKYLDGKSYRKNPKERYLSKDELFAMTSPLIEIGHHGWEHIRVSELSETAFVDSLNRNLSLLSAYSNYVPFWAYTYGNHTQFTDTYLRQQNIIPIYIDGIENFNDKHIIHRQLL